MDFGLLQKTENGKFVYNLIVGLVSTLILDLSRSLVKDVMAPIIHPYLKPYLKKINLKKNKLNFENFVITLIRGGVLTMVSIILFNKVAF